MTRQARRATGLIAVRELSDHEQSLLPPPLAAGVELDAVRVLDRAHNPYAALMRISVVRGVRIFWPGAPGEAVTLAQRAHLAHELVHVWQYVALRRTGVELLMSRVYRYSLDPAQPFLRYGYEQQAAIVEDFVRLREGGAPRWARISASLDVYARVIATAAG
ncbi:MAG: hypothetical protein U5J99_08780 [Parvularculaceae bacterium]|nr:hypothetical protein [Parvularculaceae bacterium]